jgi:ribosome-binding factor A
MFSKTKSVLQLKIQKKILCALRESFAENEMLSTKDFYTTITNVDISPNLRNLKIFVEIFNIKDEKTKKEIIKNFNKKIIYSIKDLIAKQINLKYVPEIIFILDESNEKLIKINQLIEKEKINFSKI